MDFRFGKLGFGQVLLFLLETDKEFQHPLSEKVNLEEYACKLSQYSCFSYCIEQGEMIGMISCYTNRPPEGYISNVCVKSKYRGQGVFGNMLERLLKEVAVVGVDKIRLEVDEDNVNAQKVYMKKGFVFCGNARPSSYYMELKVSQYGKSQ